MQYVLLAFLFFCFLPHIVECVSCSTAPDSFFVSSYQLFYANYFLTTDDYITGIETGTMYIDSDGMQQRFDMFQQLTAVLVVAIIILIRIPAFRSIRQCYNLGLMD